MKKVSYLIIAVLFVFNCSKDNIEESIHQEDALIMKSSSAINKKSKKIKVKICHNTDSGFQIIEVSASALNAHYSHGDLNPDKDGDGFTAAFGTENPCELGDGTDCDDNNPDVNPNAIEIYTDNIDNNCNGNIGKIEKRTVNVPCTDCRGGTSGWYQNKKGKCSEIQPNDKFNPCTAEVLVYID